MTTDNEQTTLEPGGERRELISVREALTTVSEFCDGTQPFVGERFKKLLRNAIRAIPRVLDDGQAEGQRNWLHEGICIAYANAMRQACIRELYAMKAEHKAAGTYPQGNGTFDAIAKRLESLTLPAAASPARPGAKWDKSGLKEACERGLAMGRTHQKFDLQLLLDMLLEIERLETTVATSAAPPEEVIKREDAIAAIQRQHMNNHYGATYRHAVGNIVRILRALPATETVGEREDKEEKNG